MASNTETGHNKNVTNFETLIIACTGFGATYNPSNPLITIPALTTLHTQAKTAVKEVKITQTPFNEVEGQRQTIFKDLKKTATKVINALKGVAAPATVIADAETINRKIQGKRADNSTPETKLGETPKDKNSVSQQSFDMQIDHLEKLIELISIEPKYTPNEEPIKTATLTNYKNQLEAINTTVKTTYIPYKTAMQARDLKIYAPEIGLVDISLTVKNYVKSVFGATSPEYKQISKLIFRKI
ncbi:hypothetical protein B0A78_10120 [Flavobacterium columnare NBRC 100251 = ATCC 23463]|uniref:hypothetical protein n=1 Tax=Flavobacterium columnare TaxID=996 RepID=UPI000BEA6311|nr:hypothetical protein [Flavobacterium columnare]PDS23171.1 hypothetical protein B0A78_10120 [Flavobacterium columnare NBRC 100251 = ATCC 23463]GEM59191.1 hypothetical protein FC1_24290 [Flavobacterium columnare NBRC 100251 = ATCC 23463]